MSNQYIEVDEERTISYEFDYNTGNRYTKSCSDYTVRPVFNSQEIQDNSLSWVSSFVEENNTEYVAKPYNVHVTEFSGLKSWYNLTVESNTAQTITLHQKIVNYLGVEFEDPLITTEFKLIFYKIEINDIWKT